MNPARPRRRGVFLIEVIVAITASVVVLGMSAALMGLLLRLERTHRDALTAASALDDLARALRDDVHAAASAQVVDDGRRLELPRPDGTTVSYRIEQSTIRREAARDGSFTKRETYRPGRKAEATWLVEPLDDATIVVLEVRRPSRGGPDRPAHLTRIESVVGRDHRHLQSPGGGP